MKLERSTRHDQRGFYVRPARGSFLAAAHWWPLGLAQERLGWRVAVNLFAGAGHRNPLSHLCERVLGRRPHWRLDSGVTIFLSWRARGGIPGRPHGPWPTFRVGVTTNSNAVPFGFGG